MKPQETWFLKNLTTLFGGHQSRCSQPPVRCSDHITAGCGATPSFTTFHKIQRRRLPLMKGLLLNQNIFSK